MNRRIRRRQFIKVAGLGAFSAAVASRFGWVADATAAPPEGFEGAARDGILVLGEDEPTPDWVRSVERSPKFHGEPVETFTEYMTPSELADRVSFPIYGLRETPPGYDDVSAILMHHISGFVHGASVIYSLIDPDTGRPTSTISLVAKPPGAYPEPLPIRPITLANGARVEPRRATDLPTRGFEAIGDRDATALWVERRVFYSLQILDYDAKLEALPPADWHSLVPALQTV